MNEPALVLIADDPGSLSDFRQACGRGCREVDKKADVELCVPQTSALSKCKATDVEKTLERLEPQRIKQDIFKLKIAKCINGSRPTTQNQKEIDSSIAMLNNPTVRLLPEPNTKNFTTITANYERVRAIWDALPPQPSDLQFANY